MDGRSHIQGIRGKRNSEGGSQIKLLVVLLVGRFLTWRRVLPSRNSDKCSSYAIITGASKASKSNLRRNETLLSWSLFVQDGGKDLCERG